MSELANNTASPSPETLAELPEPPANPVLGHLGEVKRDFLGAMARWREHHGDLIGFRLGLRRFVVASHPELAEEILIQHKARFAKIYDQPKPRGLSMILGKGLVTSSGRLWQRQRRTIQPMFHHSRIKGMSPIITTATQAMLDEWDQGEEGQRLDVAEHMMRLTLEIITRTMFSTSVQDGIPTFAPALNTALTYSQNNTFNPLAIPVWIPTPTNREFLKALRVLNDLMQRIIGQRKREGERKEDLLDLLLHARDEQSGETMSEQQIVDECLTIFTAGHETTANALAWSWYLVSAHPEVAQKLREEVDGVLQGRVPDFNDLPELPYTRAVMEEAMRLYPPAVAVIRKVKEDTPLQGRRIPKNAVVVINIRNIHRHPTLWERPDEFDPTRFLPERRGAIPRLAFMPFGAGPRVCIGNHLALTEGQLILAQIAQRFDLQLVPGHRVEERLAVTLRPRHGLPMILKRRR